MAVPPPESPSRTAAELATQPACWHRAADAAPATDGLPRTGERVAVTGCGTSWFMAQAYAALRETAGEGETDAFAASEFPTARRYDRVVAITRSGTTTEVLDLLAALRGTAPLLALTADPATPVRDAADALAVLDWADEESVVQTRFATTALALLRAALPGGADAVRRAAAEAASVVTEPLPAALLSASQWTFLGRGWAYGLAQEAALKMREAAGAWTESYPAMEYRHGPVAIAGAGRVTWAFGPVPDGLEEAVGAAGGTFVHAARDPLAELVRAQRVAVAVAEGRDRDPDRPRGLARSVVLGA
ncbi:SIS domain-containing protein [Streptomyces sp. NPDC021100]|uniref:SIS domain-containing protein n=1 Tax=Streptomyces sp. NPDC021100 TaxID=3365114 RepID=UPI0037B986D7